MYIIFMVFKLVDFHNILGVCILSWRQIDGVYVRVLVL